VTPGPVVRSVGVLARFVLIRRPLRVNTSVHSWQACVIPGARPRNPYPAPVNQQVSGSDHPHRERLVCRSSTQAIRLLSYNIQAGIRSRQYRDYLTKSWQHLLPHPERQVNLERIAALLQDYDLVGLQEIDGGSRRSSYIDQIAYLAEAARFPFFYRQVTRDLGRWAQHGNGVLSRWTPSRVDEHKLPGLPGRGAVLLELAVSDGGVLAVCSLHLALGWRARARQVRHIARVMERYPYWVAMGDFNCGCRNHCLRQWARESALQGLDCERKTFPSWHPRRGLDHILVSPRLRIVNAQVLAYALSDHLPVVTTVALPEGVRLA